MNINRNNYEEYFLLYVDNELSASDKKALEEFVQQNPDLKNELALLQQSILSNDAIVFGDKGSLLKEENIYNDVQENLLLHLDKELAATDARELEKRIIADESIAMEWSILQKTKLVADDSILFENKSSLYKTDKDRVVYLPWRRVAAAAVLIGVGFFAYMLFYQKTPVKNDDVVVSDGAVQKEKTITGDTVNAGAKEVGTQPENTVSVGGQKPAKQNSLQVDNSIKKTINSSNDQKDHNTVATNNDPNDKKEEFNKPEIETNSNNNTVATIPVEKQNAVVPDIKSTTVQNDIKDKTNTVEKKKDEKQILQDIAALNAESENDDRIFYVKESKLKKTKAGTLFNKAKKALNTNLSGGLNSISIGNVEIAIK